MSFLPSEKDDGTNTDYETGVKSSLATRKWTRKVLFINFRAVHLSLVHNARLLLGGQKNDQTRLGVIGRELYYELTIILDGNVTYR